MLHDWLVISTTTLIVTNLFCAIQLWTMRGKSRPKLVLALAATLLFVYLSSILAVYYLRSDFRPRILDLSYILVSILLLGLLFVYFRTLMAPWVGNRKLIRLSFYAVSGYVVLYAAFSVLFAQSPKLYSVADIAANIGAPTVWLRLAAFLNFVTLTVIFAVSTLRQYSRHRIHIAENFSFRENINLSWLPYLIVCTVLFVGWTVVDMLFGEIRWILIASNFIYAGFYMTITLLGIHQQDIYVKTDGYNGADDPDPPQASPISPATCKKLSEELVGLMEQRCEYRNSGLRIENVAKALKTNRTYLHTIIKDNFENNFIGFVNHYRIEEAKKLLSDSAVSLNIMEISERTGFKSLSSFNAFFKKETGMSPTQYRNKNGHTV
jgi:AraC-like DNA-binding protein